MIAMPALVPPRRLLHDVGSGGKFGRELNRSASAFLNRLRKRGKKYQEVAMGDLGIHVWNGASGQKYRYTVYMFGTVFGPGPANYIFAREMRPGQYLPVFIGQTQDLSEPFENHLAMQCMKLNRVTHIHIRHTDAREELRRAERSDLIAEWNPPCNEMR